MARVRNRGAVRNGGASLLLVHVGERVLGVVEEGMRVVLMEWNSLRRVGEGARRRNRVGGSGRRVRDGRGERRVARRVTRVAGRRTGIRRGLEKLVHIEGSRLVRVSS